MSYMATNQIDSGQVIQKPEIVLDERFPLPFNVRGVSLKTGTAPGGSENIVDAVASEQAEESATSNATDIAALADDVLKAPSSVTVVGQLPKYINHRTYVDVQVEIEDVQGVGEYELRITRI